MIGETILFFQIQKLNFPHIDLLKRFEVFWSFFFGPQSRVWDGFFQRVFFESTILWREKYNRCFENEKKNFSFSTTQRKEVAKLLFRDLNARFWNRFFEKFKLAKWQIEFWIEASSDLHFEISISWTCIFGKKIFEIERKSISCSFKKVCNNSSIFFQKRTFTSQQNILFLLLWKEKIYAEGKTVVILKHSSLFSKKCFSVNPEIWSTGVESHMKIQDQLLKLWHDSKDLLLSSRKINWLTKSEI